VLVLSGASLLLWLPSRLRTQVFTTDSLGNPYVSRIDGIASLGLIHTGIAFTVFIGTNTFGNGNRTNQRPNAVAAANPHAANKSVDGWLNPAAFTLPSTGTFGNLGRNTVYGPGFANVDFSLLKIDEPRRKQESRVPGGILQSSESSKFRTTEFDLRNL
jgi:hypothetical protein